MVVLEIEIGCYPGGTRPQTFLMNLLTNLKNSKNQKIVAWATKNIENPPICNTRFGDMDCNLEIESDIKNEVQRYFQTELTNLYHSRSIRYAGW